MDYHSRRKKPHCTQSGKLEQELETHAHDYEHDLAIVLFQWLRVSAISIRCSDGLSLLLFKRLYG
jgi:hypothetical protein